MFERHIYEQRRAELKRRLGSGVVLLLGNDECGCNYRDNTYNFRQDSTFLYYFGLPYAGLSAIIDIDNDREIIFGDELTIDDIVWMGSQPTLHEKAQLVGVSDVEPSNTLKGKLDQVRGKSKIHYLPTYRAEHSLKLQELLGIAPGTEQPSVDLIMAVADMRNHKRPEEISEIEKACDVTAEMHLAAIRGVREGLFEYQIAAMIEAAALERNCGLSFPTICTVNGQTLHNHYHGNRIKAGDMVLVDAGAEMPSGYAGDMSSTICAGTRFSDRQKAVYDIQVASHLGAVEMLRPGVEFVKVYERSAEIICEGMKSLGIMKGDAREAVAAGAHAMFFPCGLGHMMGLDVHDMENLGEVYVGYGGKPKSTQFGRKSLRLGRELEEGFVLTIEPGVYFIPELINLWQGEGRFTEFINYDELNKWRDFGGIRNEEDYLITADGARRLGKKIPLTTDEVEAAR